MTGNTVKHFRAAGREASGCSANFRHRRARALPLQPREAENTNCSLLVMLCLCLGICRPAWSESAPVQRKTNDRDADLVEALIEQARFDDAQSLCRWQSSRHARHKDDAAKWAIRMSQVLASQQLHIGKFEEDTIAKAKEPVTQLLEAYPDHRRALFLEAQSIAVQRQAAELEVVIAAISPQDRAQAAASSLWKATMMTDQLADRVDQERTRLESQREPSDFPLIADLVQLEQRLRVETVSLTLLQTELFADGADRIAAATAAEQAAELASTKLPAQSAARREVQRLKTEAILRAGQPDRAGQELKTLMRASPKPLSLSVLALQIRTLLANRQVEQCEKRLDAFYGDDPERAPVSLELDLVRLRYLLTLSVDSGKIDSGTVGQWLDAIERRSGGYARRRAEAISLSRLRRSSTTSSVDPSMVAAQGKDWLRRGDPVRAAELLAVAAGTATDSEQAVRYASEAAAAWIQAKQSIKAADVMATTAIKHPLGSSAAATHLQSVLLVAQNDVSVQTASRLESSLKIHLELWRNDATIKPARQWLVKILSSQKRLAEAAGMATPKSVQQINEEDLETAMQLWRSAFRSGKESETLPLRLTNSFRPLLANKLGLRAYRQLAALYLDPAALTNLPTSEDTTKTFVDDMIEFRQYGQASVSLADPPDALHDDASRRLMVDGRGSPDQRKQIAETLEGWPEGSHPSLDRVERLVWLGRHAQAIDLAKKLVAEQPDDAQSLQDIAVVLASSGHPLVVETAIELWDQLAAGSKPGSPRWHQARFASIRSLAEIGRGDEASRRAKYILLTHPGLSAELKKSYQTVIK